MHYSAGSYLNWNLRKSWNPNFCDSPSCLLVSFSVFPPNFCLPLYLMFYLMFYLMLYFMFYLNPCLLFPLPKRVPRCPPEASIWYSELCLTVSTYSIHLNTVNQMNWQFPRQRQRQRQRLNSNSVWTLDFLLWLIIRSHIPPIARVANMNSIFKPYRCVVNVQMKTPSHFRRKCSCLHFPYTTSLALH